MAFYCTIYSYFAVSVKILSALSSCETYVSVFSFEYHPVRDFKMRGMQYFRAGLPLANMFQSQVSGVHSNVWEREERLDLNGDRHTSRDLESAK